MFLKDVYHEENKSGNHEIKTKKRSRKRRTHDCPTCLSD